MSPSTSTPESVWSRPDKWPVYDPTGYVVLPRAAKAYVKDLEGQRLMVAAANLWRRRLADGELTAYALADDGQFFPVPAEPWRVEQTFQRWFRTCKVAGYDLWPGSWSSDQYWLFLPAPVVKATVSEDEQLNLSPYLRLMIDAVRALEISPDNQPKKAEVEYYLQENWSRYLDVELSENLKKSMATLVRSPEAQKGRARK